MYLNSMANYDEHTIDSISMCVFKKFNMGLPDNGQLYFAQWNQNSNYIAVGGAQGLIKVVKIGVDLNPDKAPSVLHVNQSLDGHNATVMNATWNENNQKLTTSDTSGLIIVWGIFNEQWYEEMINNRNKSVVVGIAWNIEGTKIAIAYADGSVIVGTLEGNRIWSKDLDVQLAACEWAPEGEMLIFGTADGKVTVYDEIGNHYLDINMVCLENVDLEQALAKEPQREEIICMHYWTPTLKSKAITDEIERERQKEMEAEREKLSSTSVFMNHPKIQRRDHYDYDKTPEPVQPIPPDRPRFLVAYSRGLVQLMRTLSDTEPVVIRIPDFRITGARWSPNGAFVAVCGHDQTQEEHCQATILFFSAYGKPTGYFKLAEYTKVTGISWEATGLRMTIAVDGTLLIGTVKPEFKWGVMEETFVYVFQKEELNHYGVMFFDYKTDDKNCKIVMYFEHMAFYKEHCVLINRQEDGQFFCQLCNNIGTSLDYKTTTITPKFACVNGMAAVIASEDHYFIWHFVLPKFNSVQAGIHVPGKSAEYVLEEQQRTIEYGTKRLLGGSKDEICAMCIGDTFFLIAMKVGGIYRVGLADGVITHSYPTAPNIDSIKLNCTNNRVGIVFLTDKLPFSLIINEFVGDEMKKKYSVERKEIWDFEWDETDNNMLAFKDRNRVFIYDGNSIVEQNNITGTMTSFRNLVVTACSFERFLLTPENPPKNAIQEIMVKAKQDVNSYINSMRLKDAIDYAEKNPHAELWNMIGMYALFKHEFDCAEHAFVKLGDYAGIQLVKKLRQIPSNELRNAEINAFRDDDLENARKLFLECDRKDLAVEMYKKVCDWSAVYELLEKNDDELAKADAKRHIAESNYEQLEWEDAASNYAACGDIIMQIECLINGNAFGDLEVLSRTLTDESPHLEVLGDAFASRGLGDQAVECFLRCKNPQKALKCCMELNQWQKANFIAEANHMENVEGLLGKYAIEMKGESDEKSLSALALYMRAERHLDAAKIVFDIAKDRQSKLLPYDELKECYVLGAILVEQHRQTLKQLRKIDKNNILDETLDEDAGLSAEQSRILENTWKGAEAFHFLMLAQQHFFEDKMEDALQTSVILSDYEEYLDPAEIYSMIAMAAANVRQFGICSKAMMRLETFEEFDETEKEEMISLSYRLFSDHPPVNPNGIKIPCPNCETRVDPYDLQCVECNTKFPVCIASGRLIMGNVFWLCPRCKHRAHQHEISKYNYCPLCHDVEHFKKP